MNNFELNELFGLGELLDELINEEIHFQRCSQLFSGT